MYDNHTGPLIVNEIDHTEHNPSVLGGLLFWGGVLFMVGAKIFSA